MTAEPVRRVGLDGPANFRDLGGYRAGAHRLRRGRVFRSDSLSRMTESDVRHVVDELGVVTVVDLRAGHEVETYGHGPLGSEGVLVHHLPIADETRPERIERPPDAPDPSTLTLDRIYLLMLDRYADRFVGVLRTLADDANHPIVFHCAAGKDRTGLVAALLLSLLGVDDETVAADYALTSEHIDELVDRHRAQAAAEGTGGRGERRVPRRRGRGDAHRARRDARPLRVGRGVPAVARSRAGGGRPRACLAPRSSTSE